jgi:cellulose synthase/poly-beta-1,6-N-acetylglucosamine synthase-like glycosyltransferase
MWTSLGLIAWAHAGYPLAAALAGRVRRYSPRRDDGYLPEVALIIAAHDEQVVMAERLRNALALDYPRERLEVVVALDGCSDGTRAAAEGFSDEGVRILDLPRSGKVDAQNAAVRSTSGDVVAFSDANALWQPEALRLLVRNLADSEVGYVCGAVRFDVPEDGDSQEGLYWDFELWLRQQESYCGSITGGNGAIYAVRRSAYLELEPGRSHDLGLPFRLRRRGLRSVYDPAAVARERGLASTRAEGARKARMLSRAWWEVLRGGLVDPRGQPPLYFAALVSHRALRYATGPLHVTLLLSSLLLAPRSGGARTLLRLQLAFLGLALAGHANLRLPGARVAWYYVVVTGASVAGLARALAQGPHVTWAPAREEA